MQQTEKVRPIIHENTKELSGEDTTMQLKPEEISKIIRAQIKHYENVIEQSEVGTVILVGDGIARASGLEKCMAGELLQFDNGEYGMAQNLEENTVSIVLLGSDVGIKEGSTVKRTGKVVSVPVGEALIGRVVNALGQPIDGAGPIETDRATAPSRARPPASSSASPSSEPLQTGIKAIDSMIPIGRGQRELIIGDRQTGKTTIAADTIINQKGKDVICIYVAIGQKRSTVANLVQSLDRGRRHGLHHRGLRHGFGAGAAAVYRALLRLCHGRILHASGQARPHHLRRPVQARRGLPCPVAADPPSARDVRPTPATSSICTPVCWSARPSSPTSWAAAA